ncbi:hypothetical protein [Gemmata sp.]|uniref:hypothetical protein n=1 Tax=Gemmata sp. TaxID=1914242 RepID=UPI003F711B5F
MTGTAEVICQELLGLVGGQKYFAKVLQVEGVTVTAPADKFPASKVKLALAGVPMPYSSDLSLIVGIPAPGEEEAFRSIPPGRRVRLIGYSIGAGPSGVGMQNCRVTDLGKGAEPTPVRSAEEVTAAFGREAATARKEYGLPDDGPALLLLRGKVTQSSANGDVGTYRLAGADGVGVVVVMRLNNYTKLPEVGKTVTASGLFDGYNATEKVINLRMGSVIPY